jgi:hypothetical protein
MSRSRTKSALEKHLDQSPSWKIGFQEFVSQLGRPSAFFYLFYEGGKQIIHVDSKGKLSLSKKATHEKEMKQGGFIEDFDEQIKDLRILKKLPKIYSKDQYRRRVIFGIQYMGRLKGFLIIRGLRKNGAALIKNLTLFNCLVQAETALSYRTFELQNFYETVHPRALALSTIHSVHRAMAMSTGLSELLPRVGRLCAQVLKAKRCDVFLINHDRQYLELKFSLGERKRKNMRVRIGHGIEGHVAETAEFHLSRSCVAVPFIEDDVVGIVALRDKIDGTAFTKTDMEILKTLTEQAVVAIKNAQLFEETKQLTAGSIKTINELLELSFSGDNIHLPLFGEIAFLMGRDLKLKEDELTHLHRATFLIDAGQLGTPEEILKKSDRLTETEFEAIKQHPTKGAAILAQIGSLKPVIPIILHHHERFDGKGYPSKLRGDEIPIGGRIVAVVDSFTAMLSKRPYRKILKVDDAIKEIESNSGTQFDPKVVASFMKVVRYPQIAQKLQGLRTRGPQPVSPNP